MNKKSGFEKFHKGGPKKGAALKEHFRQEKKAQTRERKAFFEQQRADKAAARQSAADGNVTPRSTVQRRNTNEAPGKFPKEGRGEGGKPTRAAGGKPERFNKEAGGKPERFNKEAGGKPERFSKEKSSGGSSFKDYRAQSEGPRREVKSAATAPARASSSSKSGAPARSESGTRNTASPKGAATRAVREHTSKGGAPVRTEPRPRTASRPKGDTPAKTVIPAKAAAAKAGPAQMPLNKYLAHGGVCGRREAAELVKSGKVLVNGAVVTEPGYKVQESDTVTFGGKKVTPTGNLVYILLNKPKDYITTTDDPQQRKTVLDLIARATEERVYPVGRLDRNTSGVLLLTNDGELAQRLTHPSNQVRKVYAVSLDKALTKAHFEEILKGTPLEDGLATVDSLAYADPSNKKELGIEIHSGKNRVVRRIFEHYGYDVKGLDRVIFAGLTKKNVPRGKWRFLAEKEVRDLKFFKKGKK